MCWIAESMPTGPPVSARPRARSAARPNPAHAWRYYLVDRRCAAGGASAAWIFRATRVGPSPAGLNLALIRLGPRLSKGSHSWRLLQPCCSPSAQFWPFSAQSAGHGPPFEQASMVIHWPRCKQAQYLCCGVAGPSGRQADDPDTHHGWTLQCSAPWSLQLDSQLE